MQYTKPLETFSTTPAFFGCDDFEIFEVKEQSEGYIAGTLYAANLQETILTEFAGRSKAYREGLIQALREQL